LASTIQNDRYCPHDGGKSFREIAMNILMISSTFPYPSRKGGTQGRTFNLLKYLSKNHDITVIVQSNADVRDEEVDKLGKFVSELVVFTRPRYAKTGIIAKLQRLAQLLQQEMQNWIDRAVKSQKFSVITSEHSVNEIYIRPQGQITYPDTTLTLVGGNPSLEVQELTKLKGVIVTGRVPSMTTYLHQATMAVIPLRTGFEIYSKTLESMAAGVLVVASDRGLERLTVAVNNVPLAALMANSIEQYCTAISSLFKSAELREKLSRNARKLIEYNYTWQQAAGKYEQVLTADIC
jgi:glycosyltransferase involved in cell wall biosynthesis